MAEIKLLSIKRNPEVSYFYENKGATLDTNSNEVSGESKEQEASKKAGKAAEKKERKQQERESKKREKEMKKKKTPLKESVSEVATVIPNDQENENPVNGDDKCLQFNNSGFHAGIEDKNEETVNDISHSDSTLVSGAGTSTVHTHVSESMESSEIVLNVAATEKIGEDISKVVTHDATPLEPAPEIITNDKQSLESKEEDQSAHETTPVEQTIAAEEAVQSEEAPPESSWQVKPNPEFVEGSQPQHVQIEISDITESENMPEVSNGYVVHASSEMEAESMIVVATVHEVESGMDLDSFFLETYGEPGQEVTEQKRVKSVRFQEPAENGDNVAANAGSGTGDADTVATNGDCKADEGDKNDEQRSSSTKLEPVDKSIGKEVTSNVESVEVNWDEIFESCENDSPTSSGTAQIEIENHRTEVGEKARANNHRASIENIQSLEVTPNDKQNDKVTRKKDKRKRTRWARCCFP